MEDFEEAALANYPTGDDNLSPSDIILFWYRKADDTIIAIRDDHIDSFHNYLNSIHTDIQWTKEVEENGRINMLDVTVIHNTDGSLDFDVYRKPTHTNQYIPFDSHQPLSHKFSTIHALTPRAALIPSTDDLKKKELERVKEALSINGYPKWAFDRARYRPPPPAPLPPSENAAGAVAGAAAGAATDTTAGAAAGAATGAAATTRVRLGNVSLPYFSGITEPLSRVLNSKGLSTSVKARGSLRENLVKPKDKLEKKDKTGVIYHIPCAGVNSTPCAGTYIGETERTAAARLQEHTSTATNALGHFKSAMLQHARENGHHFRKEDASILDHEQNWARRGIKEAIYIKALAPSINIDPGRHTLSSHFDNIIRSQIKAPASPTPHNAQVEQLIHTAPRRQGRPRKQIGPVTTSQQPPEQHNPQPNQTQEQTQTLRRSQRNRNTQ